MLNMLAGQYNEKVAWFGLSTTGQVINLFVISRVAQGYEGRSTVVDAAEWLAAGQPELPPEVSIYGAANLEIVAEQGEPEPVFLVSYDFFSPGGDSVESFNFGTPMRERVFLRRDKEDWVIFNFQEVPVPSGS